MRSSPCPSSYSCWAPYDYTICLCLPRLHYQQGFVSQRAFGVSGIGIACVEVFVASIVSSSFAFFLARHLCLNRVRVWTAKSKNLKLVETLMKQKGFRIVLMLRLASVLPFGTLNYVMSVLSVSYTSFLLGSVGLLPYIITCKNRRIARVHSCS